VCPAIPCAVGQRPQERDKAVEEVSHEACQSTPLESASRIIRKCRLARRYRQIANLMDRYFKTEASMLRPKCILLAGMVILALRAGVAQSSNPLGCDTWVAMKDATEKWIFQRQRDHEAQALELIKKQQQDAAAALLQKYVDENCSRIAGEYKKLNEELPAKLEATGCKFLFVDYLKDWTSKAGVPLPGKN
jgi:hypothetical protein